MLVYYYVAEDHHMKDLISDMVAGAIVGACFAVPLMLLEYVNTQGFATAGFPAVLFVALWLLPFVLTLLMMPVVRNLRSGNGVTRNPAVFVLQAVLAICIVVILANLVTDQAPCFMGVPNCD